MREILFRGKRVDNGEWIEGFYYPAFDDLEVAYMLHSTKGIVFEVIPESVGQFTGLTDKNGVKVFEGDYDIDGQVVLWCEKCCGWTFGQLDIPTADTCIPCHYCEGNYHLQDSLSDFVICGTIHDNTELLTK